MKKLALLLISSAFICTSCGDAKKEKAAENEPSKIEKKSDKKVAKTDPVAGKTLFGSKGCVACHHETTKIIGPSVKDIAAGYSTNNGDIFKFLKGEADAIIDTDPTQVSIMKNNVETMVKDISDADLTNIVAYINSVK